MNRMDKLVELIYNKVKELSDLEKVYNFYINLYDKDDVDLIFYHLYKILFQEIYPNLDIINT